METFPGRVPFSKDESFMPLRAPRTAPTQSTLSANAQEFVPKGAQQGTYYNNTNQTNQNHFHRQNHNSHHPHRYPNGYQRMPNQHQQQQQHNHNHHHHHHQHQQQVMNLTSEVQDRLKFNGHQGGGNRAHGNDFYTRGQHRPSSSSSSYHGNQQHQQHQHQQQHPSTSSSSSSSSHHYKNKSNNQRSNDSNDLTTVALDYLGTIIECLNRNPGQFDTLATRFLTIFDGMENNQYVLSIAMEDIFKESTQNSNFRYMGAKLYNLLYMLNLKQDSLFLQLLKCKLDFHQNEVAKYMQNNEHGKVRETALFLAELFMQLRGHDSRIQLLAENIVYSLKQLLASESNDNVRCICLTLKLAGYDLNMDCQKDIEEIIGALSSIEARAPGKYPIVGSVLALQKDNWGRKLSSSISMSESEGLPEPPRASDEPIFYGPDGRELTAEETDFLADDTPGGAGGSTDDDDDDLDLEMDAESAKAYKEFCKQQIC